MINVYFVLFSEQSTHSVQTVIHDSALGVKSSTANIYVDSGEFYISIQTDDRLRTVTVSTGKVLLGRMQTLALCTNDFLHICLSVIASRSQCMNFM